MTTNEIKHVLLWCTGLNYAILCMWFGSFVIAHDWIYRLQCRWFKLSVETFDAIQERGLRVFKIGIIYLTWRCWSHSSWFGEGPSSRCRDCSFV